MQTPKWFWTNEKIANVLAGKIAMSAVAGRPSPVAAKVLARLMGEGV